MFGLKLFTKVKTKKFASDKARKQYYAIQDYYRRRAPSKPTTPKTKTKEK